jgi:hypothetical protein
MRKKTIIPIFFISIVAIAALAFYVHVQDQVAQASPATVVSVSAKLAGDNGTMISVEYQTDRNMTANLDANRTYLIDESSGKRLGVQWVSYIGPLISQSVGKASGWFVIDNAELSVINGTQVTIVIGNFTKEHYEVTWP